MPHRPTSTMDPSRPRYDSLSMDGETLLQLFGLIAIVVSLSLFVYDGFGIEIFGITVIGILAIVAPDAVGDVLHVFRRKR